MSGRPRPHRRQGSSNLEAAELNSATCDLKSKGWDLDLVVPRLDSAAQGLKSTVWYLDLVSPDLDLVLPDLDLVSLMGREGGHARGVHLYLCGHEVVMVVLDLCASCTGWWPMAAAASSCGCPCRLMGHGGWLAQVGGPVR